ncbi:MAG: TlyA family rRNA (cytidine-2'-O)-methyltransferase [Phycisphaerae bacterium]|nr:TlyA family rRNA (cytidine-2'-O)-methyltransferase [Phycisphaerae bacterium]|tara:strand:- start:3882 stop:4490 length:609 start_codon:yes stop_codon:yes gene_type:complete
MASKPDSSFVSRAGLKLEHALDTFDFDVTGMRCADLGCNVGGFTDCLLQRGAASVFAVDTGYGTLAWKLRSDERVTTLERSNALHLEPPELVDLVVIDLGWTPQILALPAGMKWTNCGHIISLIKPHYELTTEEKNVEKVGEGLSDDAVSRVIARTKVLCEDLSLELLGETLSPIRGKKSSKKGGGNSEYLMLFKTTSLIND